MMNTLLINAHPLYKDEGSFSGQLQALFIEKFRTAFPTSNLEFLNLYEQNIPRIEENELFAIWNKQRQNELLTAEEEKKAQVSRQLLETFKAHHRIVIVSPLHNFNITSRMKDYIDNIMIARETFRYTENGSVGLMTDNYKAMFLLSSGSVYTNNDRYTTMDFAPRYLQGIFKEMMGFNEFYIVRAEGTSILPKEEVLAKATSSLYETFTEFYAD
ncbi:MAG: NAD(P)H-dependent oxidoreductase [Cruoricaptor ignavus]|nr:NAD(P)H-dependent oxidoreductase [Cruoricaptor ignavus]